MKAKTPFILLIFVAVATAAATVVESLRGSDSARMLVYNSMWYFLLWLLTAVGGLWLILRKKLWRRPALMLLHISFLVILLGATLTRMTGYKGVLHVREGEGSNELIYKKSDGDISFMTLPIGVFLMKFEILYDKDSTTPKDYISHVVLADKSQHIPVTINMNNIGRLDNFRIYQTSYDDDLKGSVLTVSYDPWGTAVTYLGYVLLAVGMIWSSLRLTKTNAYATSATGSSKWKKIAIWAVGGVLASYMIIAIAAHPLMPVLRSPMLFIHVSVICISYVLLIVSFMRRDLLRPAVCMLAAGIFLGAIWANISWGTYWSWDPKESWALVTLIIYSLPLHTESLPWFRSQKNYRIYSILSLLSLLMTYFGVNYILGGMHSYMG